MAERGRGAVILGKHREWQRQGQASSSSSSERANRTRTSETRETRTDTHDSRQKQKGAQTKSLTLLFLSSYRSFFVCVPLSDRLLARLSTVPSPPARALQNTIANMHGRRQERETRVERRRRRRNTEGMGEAIRSGIRRVACALPLRLPSSDAVCLPVCLSVCCPSVLSVLRSASLVC